MDNKTKEMLFALGIATSIGALGALTGLALSFTALSPLVMGGIIAAVPVALLACRIISNRRLYKEVFFRTACFCSVCTAIGVGLAAAATAVFPGAMLGMVSAALAGAVIAPIAVMAGVFVTVCVIEPIAEKVNDYIISPIVEKVGKCFSSKEEENGLVKE
ncbi:hypothetical protein [Wolbachia endosymbiont of Frankliniella intonsa]|uniref:hypothetical protein n=1 Tax=Wolbachia endosymbiont of Frankliniella intonsa TaxID=2902422 RepID=UPI00244EFA7A|nr:hypothetical protein [Wolbachia endosymbiont of Frankliniella intonsa]WGJ62421.1 hypothetical protein M3L71_01925 [Wolbachia endosymbiont of Frankliniella intonsa]